MEDISSQEIRKERKGRGRGRAPSKEEKSYPITSRLETNNLRRTRERVPIKKGNTLLSSEPEVKFLFTEGCGYKVYFGGKSVEFREGGERESLIKRVSLDALGEVDEERKRSGILKCVALSLSFPKSLTSGEGRRNFGRELSRSKDEILFFQNGNLGKGTTNGEKDHKKFETVCARGKKNWA